MYCLVPVVFIKIDYNVKHLETEHTYSTWVRVGYSGKQIAWASNAAMGLFVKCSFKNPRLFYKFLFYFPKEC